MFKLTIPKPCHENWEQMLPNEQGRHCLQCSKTVVDFTDMNDFDVQHYFLNNQQQSTCGRFQTKQLNEIVLEILLPQIPIQTSWHKRFRIAAFLVFGTFLFSCTNINDEKVGKIVVKDSISVLHVDTTLQPIIPPTTYTLESVATSGMVCVEPQKKEKPKCVKDTFENITKGEIAMMPIDTVQLVDTLSKPEPAIMGKPVLIKK